MKCRMCDAAYFIKTKKSNENDSDAANKRTRGA